MAVSKRARYEVLRRDNFTCRYCGGKAPDVPLTVDHVLPVALGGTDEPANLVTACRDCNAGKTSTPPDAALVEDVQADAERWSKAVEAAQQKMLQRRDADEEVVQQFLDAWDTYAPYFADLPADCGEHVLRYYRQGLPVQVIVDAVITAAGANHVTQRQRFRYYLGILNNRMRALHDAAAEIARDETD